MKKAGSTVLLLAALLAAVLQLHTACGQSTPAKPTDTKKPGVCPPERYYQKGSFNDSYCQTDKDCDTNEKCCVDNFDKMCKPPAEERAGECPTTSYKETSQNRTADFCTSDSECAPNAKCCMKNGGMTCQPSAGVKPGECPPDPIRCIRGIRTACMDDSTCQGNKKCCSSKCGMECLPPNTEGFCPPDTTPPNVATICLVRCDNCTETQMCCSSGCLQVCKEMTKERPGYCPPNFLKCAIREILCKDDLSCSDTEKCCDSECKRQCVPLRNDKSGLCPAPSTSCQPTNDTPDPNPICTKDLHCPGDKKCCIVGCSQNCTEPTFV